METVHLTKKFACQEQEALYLEAKHLYYHMVIDEKLSDARAIFQKLGDYKNSRDFVKKCDALLDYRPGNIVLFGRYQGKPIRWRVLQAKGKSRLLFSEKIITGQPYNTERTNTYWSTSTLRKWLNHDFLNEAFTLSERMSIITVPNVNDPNSVWSTQSGPKTIDKAFVFSHKELEEYLPDPADRAIGEWWWTRTIGHNLLSAECVYFDGSIYDIGLNIADGEIGVRPAIWITLKR